MGKFYLGDVVTMRKAHPCGENRWEVLRTGMDFRLRCLGCRRVVMLPRKRFERDVRQVIHRPMEEGLPSAAPTAGGSKS